MQWFGLQPLNQEDGATTANRWRWGWNNISQPTELLTSYPFAGVYSDQDATLAGSVDLGSGMEYDYPSLYFEEGTEVNAVSTTPYKVCNGLYEMFWEHQILNLLERPKIKKAFFKLTPKDIASLDFRKLIYIQGEQSDTYWIINKIVDYKGAKNILTQVELYEWINAKPMKNLFPQISQGWGKNLTGQWTDYNQRLVNADGDMKVTSSELSTRLDIFSKTKTPKLIQGVEPKSLPVKKQMVTGASGNKIKRYTDDGTRVPMTGKFKTSANVGNNINLNTGSDTIGNKLQPESGQILIGNNNNTAKGGQPIEIAHNGRTAMCVDPNGMFIEGGGGVVYYEDGTEMKEVMTGIPQTYNPISAKQSYFYTRVVKDSERII